MTIELRDAIPAMLREGIGEWVFGCDVCQEVCPWNRFSKPTNEESFSPHPDMLNMTEGEWHEITEEVFQRIFKKSAVKRTKYRGLKRNLSYLKA